jgi:hypothetical protein
VFSRLLIAITHYEYNLPIHLKRKSAILIQHIFLLEYNCFIMPYVVEHCIFQVLQKACTKMKWKLYRIVVSGYILKSASWGNGVFVTFLIIILYFSFNSKLFLTWSNICNLLPAWIYVVWTSTRCTICSFDLYYFLKSQTKLQVAVSWNTDRFDHMLS